MLKTLKFPVGGEIGMLFLIIAILSLMILPLPTFMIDILVGLNIAASVTLLMITLYVPSVVSLSAFPSLLLFTTLYRLSLSIASTKSILLHAEAGEIIDSFGKLVVGGNLVVGMVVFIIITLVQFIVIAKGSERVAEVGARFTLDAMPGKQMSIDADLRANLLTSDEARHKRATLALESALHGGMDGAMKFVKGDAVAGLIITVINIVAGLAVGVAYHGMTAAEAANRFSILSVGDAMVAQVPALLLSVAAGVMITRVADDRDETQRSLGADIGRQLITSPPALFFAAVLLLAFAAVPGFPWLLFILLSGVLAFAAYRLQKSKPSRQLHDGESVRSMQRVGAKIETPAIAMHPPAFTCALGVRIAPDLVARLSLAGLNTSFEAEREVLQEELGLPFPGITMWTSDRLAASTCEFLMHDVPYLTVEIPPGKVVLPTLPLALAREASGIGEDRPGDAELRALAPNCEQRAPLDGSSQPSYWHEEKGLPAKTEAWRAEQVIAHVSVRLLRRHASLFLGVQEVQWIQEQLGIDYPGLLAEVQKVLPPQRIADVLRRLLEEQIPIRNVRNIMESLIAWGPKEKDMLMLTEYVRGDLARFLAHRATQGAKVLPAVLLDGPVEQHIRQAIKQTPTGNYLALPPDEVTFLLDSIEAYAGTIARDDIALVTSMDIRRYVRRMLEGKLDWLNVYSYQELGGLVELQPIGRVTA
ncbi:type III secretion system export apparatus subunit SctV [Paraburkholderia caledonica]|jgi:type III secretion protein V|uniref:type III secretion system export apparatus subunit SctV n=1 Tax=Paraburkholderia caledonica TaxID=134536 RepID=UPI000D75C0C0|nr:type III secretion system export apparatus subunit SctV [Paraburkholderia caledonica]AXF14854.1 EscV/YscV/HrcV family type III secretion system export apparatus protein [Paraburkholderia caledonica]